MQDIPDNSIEVMITDPPYGISKPTDRDRSITRFKRSPIKIHYGEWDELTGDARFEWCDVALPKIKHWAIIFCGQHSISKYIEKLEEYGFHPHCGVWYKKQTVLNYEHQFVNSWEAFVYGKRPLSKFYGRAVPNVFKNTDQDSPRIHPNQKPLKLICDLMQCVTKPGDTVLDPFLGSGTTAMACKKLQRKIIGFERELEYYNKIQKRLKGEENVPMQLGIDGNLPVQQRRGLRRPTLDKTTLHDSRKQEVTLDAKR